MKRWTGVILAIAGSLAGVMVQDVCAQATAPPPPSQAPATRLSAAQLDQMLAPIALYPDPLLTQILMASTYPLEVVEADRWVHDPHNAALTGSDLEAALASESWDPSVKSLAPFPQILRMMDNNLSWTEQLGDAFLSDRPAVMESVQRLRRQAEAAGNLRSSDYATVKTQGSAVLIEPVQPTVVYVPVYDPYVVYGTWLYPAYPPFYFPGYFDVVVAGPVVGFGWFGFTLVAPLWGWGFWDWDHHHVFVDRHRFNDINRGRRRIDDDVWHHDPFHRHGVPYRDARTRERFDGDRMREMRTFRGYPMATPPATTSRQRQPGIERERRTMPQAAPRPPERFRQPSPPAFESFGRGAEVRSQSERGFSSRNSVPMMRNPGAMPRFGGGGERFQGGGQSGGQRGGGGGSGRSNRTRGR